MLPDDDTCYAAMQARDGRFDGRFFVGVLTTGVYCRPVCPARTPLRRNVRFFATASAASAAGLRACKRCRPDSIPGSRDWDHRGDLVGRALRLIGSGACDGYGVAGLALELSVSERHLRRMLVAEVGVGPLELARTRRAQTARMLIEQTAMPLADVSFAAGFASVRQSNDVIKQEFGMTPTQLRRRAPRRSGGRSPAGATTVNLRLRYRDPYDVDAVLAWSERHAVPGLDVTGPRSIASRFGNGDAVDCVFTRGSLTVSITTADVSGIAAHVHSVRQWLDLEANPAAINDVLERDPVLAPMVRARPGMRVVGSPDAFRVAVLVVLGQQVSVRAAATTAGRLVAAHGGTSGFPTAGVLADLPPDQLAADLGIPRRRAATLVALGSGVAAGNIDLTDHSDRELASARLAAIPGVGPWTVAEIRMRALRDPDVWPPNDLVLRRRVATDPAACSPWRSYAAHHVWAASHDAPGASGQPARMPNELEESA